MKLEDLLEQSSSNDSLKLEDLLVQSNNNLMKLEDLLVHEEHKDHRTTSRHGRDHDARHHLPHHHHHHNQKKQQQQPQKLGDNVNEDEKIALLKKKKKRGLEKEVAKMQGELEDEQALNKALRAMLRGPVLSQPRLSLLLLPPQVQELIEELATVEAEILCLEKRIQELKLDIHNEKKENEVREEEISFSKEEAGEEEEEQWMNPRPRLQRQNHLPCETSNVDLPLAMTDDLQQRTEPQSCEDVVKETKTKISPQTIATGSPAAKFSRMISTKTKSPRTVSVGSAMEFSRISTSTFSGELVKKRAQTVETNDKDSPNGISEELVKCLMGIYLELSRTSREREGSATVSKLSLSHLKNASFKRKSVYEHSASNLDPYGVVTGNLVRDIGQYKNFIHITRSSIDVSRLSDCSTSIVTLRVLLEKLNKVDLSFLTHKKKLAFWINTYNACVMNGFLEHGLPSSKEKLFSVLNMATIDVGGTQLTAEDIEDFILLNPSEQQDLVEVGEREANLQKRYGLRCKESNLAFVLCHGHWSSPAVRVYTAEGVVNELIKARTEYLEASIGVSSRRRIVIPRLLHLRYRDFAEDEKSLLEWICSQLPPLQRCMQLKEAVIECLKHRDDVPMDKVFEVQYNHHEFRFLLPL